MIDIQNLIVYIIILNYIVMIFLSLLTDYTRLQIALIASGVAAAVVLLMLVLLWCWCKRRRSL